MEINIIENELLGLKTDAWNDIAKLYIHVNEKDPKDLFELRNFWDKLQTNTPKDVVDLSFRIIASQKIKTEIGFNLVRAFLLKNG